MTVSGGEHVREGPRSGFIDAATTYGGISALGFGDPQDVYSWAWQNAIEVTSALIATKHLRLSPEPGIMRPPTGDYGMVLRELGPALGIERPSPEIIELARERTRRWARKNVEKLRRMHNNLYKDQKGFGNWLEWNIRHVWPEHCNRFGGLCDRVFSPDVAVVLGISEKAIEEIQEQCADQRTLRDIVRRGHAAVGHFQLMLDAYVMSVLIRGRYYGHIAALSSSQLLHHQTRDALFPAQPMRDTEFPLSNVERYVATILVASAYRERKYNARIAAWTAAILRVRELAVHRESVDLREKRHDSVALDEAFRVAKEAGVRTTSKLIDHGINAGASIGVGVLTSFVLSPLGGFVAGLGAQYAMKRLHLGERAGSFLERPRRLRELARAGAGSIRRTWAGAVAPADKTSTLAD